MGGYKCTPSQIKDRFALNALRGVEYVELSALPVLQAVEGNRYRDRDLIKHNFRFVTTARA